MSTLKTDHLEFRESVLASDVAAVGEIVASVGVFSPTEVGVAVELASAALTEGKRSGYFFLFAASAETVIGYTCYGAIPATKFAFDLYWIAVRERYRGLGIGKQLLARTEAEIRRSGGRRIYVETSSQPGYAAAREFYSAQGYRKEATLEDFYAAGDSKLIYAKVFG